jgi:single-strand DNA-binding protein
MAGLNKVILIGNLGKDPEIMTFENGVKKATYSLATTESYRDKDGNWVDQTEWHNIVAWRWLAEKTLIKGDQIYVEGKLKTRSWDDNEGRKHYITEVYADKILKLTRRDQPAQGQHETPPPVTPEQYPEVTEENGPTDDLPF